MGLTDAQFTFIVVIITAFLSQLAAAAGNWWSE
jgi:hypothetical protein